VSVVWFHRHLAPVAYRGAVVVSGEMVLVTLERALFLVGGQLRRSRSAHPVRAMRVALISSRRFMVGQVLTGTLQQLQGKWRVLLRSFLSLHRLFVCLVVSFLCLSVSVNSDFASRKGAYIGS